MPLSAPRAQRRRRRWWALGVGVLVVVGVAWGARSLLGPPGVMTDAEARLWLDAQPDEDRFAQAFWYGEQCGARMGFEELLAHGGAFPEALQGPFFDGAGHGMRWSNPDPQRVAARVEVGLPPELRPLFHDSVLRSVTEEARGEPDVVLPFVERYARMAPRHDPAQGVRVGLQRSRGGDLADAIRLSARYPGWLQSSLYEELGWRFGNDHGERPARLAPLMAQVPDARRCDFAHGAVRGLALRTDWTRAGQAHALALIAAAGDACSRPAMDGLASGLSLRFGHHASALEAHVRPLPAPVQRVVRQRLRTRGGA